MSKMLPMDWVLIDGSSILYRAFYGVTPLHSSSGVPTGAILGFAKSLQKLLQKFAPKYLIVCWDHKESLRKQENALYKAKREACPQDLIIQHDWLVKLLDGMQISQLRVAGYEADDLLATAANYLISIDQTSLIVSADKDLLQLVNDKVYVWDPSKDVLYDPQAVVARFGFPIEKIPFYFSLVGDASDGITGVPGVGPKGAQDLVEQFDNLEHLYQNLQSVEKVGLRNKLLAGHQEALESMRLFLPRMVDGKALLDPVQRGFSGLDWLSVKSILLELGLKSLLPKDLVVEDLSKAKKNAPWSVILIQTEKQLEDLVLALQAASLVAIDVETTGLNWREAQMVGISLCCDGIVAYYIPFAHTFNLTIDSQDVQQLGFDKIMVALESMWNAPQIAKLMHHAKFDLHFWQNKGIALPQGRLIDTMIAARLVLPEWLKVGLKSLATTQLGLEHTEYQNLFKEYATFAQVPLQMAANYAAADAAITWRLWQHLIPLLGKDMALQEGFWNIEMPLVEVLLAMERNGITLDMQLIKSLEQESLLQKNSIEQKIKDFLETQSVFEPDLNLNSPKQLEVLLFDVLQLKPAKKTGQGSRSTNEEVLEDLAKEHPLPGLILQYRKIQKLLNTYLVALPKHVDAKTGRIHTDYMQTAVATGRLSSVEPNLQNIPTDSKIRSCFVAASGKYLLSADYSQIELRILAQLTQDPNLLKAFAMQQDVHAQTAAEVFNVDLLQVTAEQRNVGKRLNFSILYGLSAHRLSQELEIPHAQASDYINAFFRCYPTVKPWMEKVVTEAQQNGCVTTMWGRKRWIANINDSNKILAQAGQRAAVNAVIQGSAAELMKKAMLQLFATLKKQGLNAQILLQVHDELILEVDQSIPVAQIFDTVYACMVNLVDWQVPLEVAIKIGPNWGHLERIKNQA